LGVASRAVPVSMGVSIALTDETIHAALEPGTPTPRARLELVRAIVEAGLPCQVLVAPILPMITDSDEQLDQTLGEIAAAGATGATVFALHLRPGAREWFMRYLHRHHPQLVEAYAELYRNGSYVTRSYASDLARRSAVLVRKHGLNQKDSMLRIPDTQKASIPPHLALSEPSLF
jgi:DNA repair photolyase